MQNHSSFSSDAHWARILLVTVLCGQRWLTSFCNTFGFIIVLTRVRRDSNSGIVWCVSFVGYFVTCRLREVHLSLGLPPFGFLDVMLLGDDRDSKLPTLWTLYVFPTIKDAVILNAGFNSVVRVGSNSIPSPSLPRFLRSPLQGEEKKKTFLCSFFSTIMCKLLLRRKKMASVTPPCSETTYRMPIRMAGRRENGRGRQVLLSHPHYTKQLNNSYQGLRLSLSEDRIQNAPPEATVNNRDRLHGNLSLFPNVPTSVSRFMTFCKTLHFLQRRLQCVLEESFSS
ncbi:hypothetical protein CEXT_369731 [Caerostris extrusa]|uniref:Uncharacterized protein n=1 Tax=Caerostris extrusa TaxID=172846 RepID=A0AAV4UP34_CAEEX|nr:hypothetical protein CEXT_369731 [Caerostris extrusa]